MMTAAIVVSGLAALPAKAATVVPEVVQITDPAGDANYVNDQGFAGTGVGVGGQTIAVPDSDDNVTCGTTPDAAPCDIGSASDVLAVWFSNTATEISAHILTEAPAPATQGLTYRVHTNPGEGTLAANATGCLWWEASVAGVEPNTGQKTTYHGETKAQVRDLCDGFTDGNTIVPAVYATEALEDGTGIISITLPRSINPKFGDGAKIISPYLEVRNLNGPGPTPCQPVAGCAPGGATAPVIESTKRGIDFDILGAGPPPPPPPPPVCKKKQKASCKCPVFVPAEVGADATLTKITEKATKKNPEELTVSTGAGAGVGGVPGVEEGIAHAFENLQIDLKKKKSSGLYVRLEMPSNSDYDLTLLNSDGTVAASAAGFNPETSISDGTGTGGHSEATAEQIDGIKTPECGGYTADIGTATGLGGGLTMKLWLGKVNYEQPVPEPTEGGSNAGRGSVGGHNGWVKASRYF